MKKCNYYLKQKMVGAIMLILSGLTIWLGEGTPALLFAPFGLWLIFSKDTILQIDEYSEINEEEIKKF